MASEKRAAEDIEMKNAFNNELACLLFGRGLRPYGHRNHKTLNSYPPGQGKRTRP